MIGTREKIFQTVLGVLADQVLPELTAKSWMAANIRACIVLLTYLQDKVANDEPALTATNAAMLELMNTLAARDPAWLDAKLRSEIMAHPAAGKDIAAVEAESEVLKALLVRCIRQHRDAGGSDADFSAALQPCLLMLSTADANVAERAAALQPL